MSNKIQKNNIDWFVINRIKEIRLEKNISQVDIAVHLNITSGFIGQVESPNTRAKYKTLHLNEIAKLLECSPKDFWPEKPL